MYRGLHILAGLVWALSHLSLYATNLGIPFIQNYEKDIYKGSPQNWDVFQGKDGRMYFANNEGVLTFDGRNWHIYPLPNRTIVRSVCVGPKGRIFAGGQDELGYFFPGKDGQLTYTSLKGLLPDSLAQFEDVWDIRWADGILWFRTLGRIYGIDGDKVNVLEGVGRFELLQVVDEQLYVFDDERGLLSWKNEEWEVLATLEDFGGGVVNSLVSRPAGLWVATIKRGLFSLTAGNKPEVKRVQVPDFSGVRIHVLQSLENQRLAIGTAAKGVFILDENGKIVQHLTRAQGLLNNHVLEMCEDRSHNLWVSLNNGIACIRTGSRMRRIVPDPTQISPGYTIKHLRDRWYMGTALGLYTLPNRTYYDPLELETPVMVPGSNGQVWGLREVGASLWMGHNEGAFRVETEALNTGIPVGTWDFVSVPGYKDVILAGTYTGLFILKQINGVWQNQGQISGFDQSSRLIVSDDQQRVWIAHPYRGVFSLDFSQGLQQPSIQHYGKAEGLPDDNFNHIFPVMGEVLVGTIKGVYGYNDSTGHFAPRADIQAAIGQVGWVKQMAEGPHGEIWFILDDKVGLLNIKDEGLKKEVSCIFYQELEDQLLKGHEFLYPTADSQLFVGTYDGFIRLDWGKQGGMDDSLRALLQGIWATGDPDSLLFGGYFGDSTQVLMGQDYSTTTELPATVKSLRFEVAAPWYKKSKTPIRYRYYLEGIESGWLAWGPHAVKEYSNLRPGRYRFWYQAQDPTGRLSAARAYSFRILPPWYASQTAQWLYAFLLLGIVLAMVLIPRLRYRQEKQRLQSSFAAVEAQKEKEITALKTQSLQEEIRHKNEELASATMHLVQKNEMLLKVKSGLESFQKTLEDKEIKSHIKRLIRMVEQDIRLDKNWEQFVMHFDQVHSGFFKRLSENYPQLTPKDHRLCAYLRMNLSTKEIAPLMNISVRGVEISRYRLRKKLDLDHEINLNEFMMQY